MRVLPYVLALALGAGAAGLAACGDEPSRALIPAAEAGPLTEDFDAVADAVAEGDCPAAGQAIARARAKVDALPRTTSERLRSRLREGLGRLAELAPQECLEAQTQTETQPTVTETVPPETAPPTTPTAPPETTPTVPPETTPAPQPEPDPAPEPEPVPEDTGGAVTP